MEYEVLFLIAILFPIVSGVLLLVRRLFHSQKHRDIYVFFVLLASTALIFCSIVFSKGELTLFRLTRNIAFELRADLLSKLFSGLVAVIWLLVGVYALRYLKGTGKTGLFYCTYLITLSVLQGLAASGNLVTFYLFYEWMTLMTVPLVLQMRTREAVRAARKYMFYSIAGASLSLFGIMLLAGQMESLSFCGGGVPIVGDHGVVSVAVLLMIFGFGTKAGLFPMHGWLPVAHPAAPAPASAVLSGVITKAGVLGMVRVIYYVVGAGNLAGTVTQAIFLVFALVTVFMGSMLAYKEKVLKKRLAYSSISQVSYVLLGVALMTQAGLAAGLLHMVFHSVMKCALFLFAGTVIHETKETSAGALRGIGKRLPFTLLCFTLASLALVGIPPFAGFVSKWYLAMGALSAPVGAFSYLAPAILLVSALLTAFYLLPIAMDGFFPGKEFIGQGEEAKEDVKEKGIHKAEGGPMLLLPLLLLSLATLFLGIFPSPLFSVIQEIAQNAVGL